MLPASERMRWLLTPPDSYSVREMISFMISLVPP